jgi:macrodomain Ter protein organizer (MatP/YcbG family)
MGSASGCWCRSGTRQPSFHIETEMKIRRKSLIVKRSIRVAGRRTGVSVEDAFWNRFKEIAADRNMTLSDLVTTINSKRKHNNYHPPSACSCSTMIDGKPSVC